MALLEDIKLISASVGVVFLLLGMFSSIIGASWKLIQYFNLIDKFNSFDIWIQIPIVLFLVGILFLIIFHIIPDN